MYKIPCSWQMYGYAYVEADNLSDAIDKVEDADLFKKHGESTPLPHSSSYVEESLEVDYDVVEDMNGKEQLPGDPFGDVN
jgi:hypothetical protein